MEELVREYIRTMRLTPGLNTRRIYEAWDEASGAAHYTLRRYFRDGTLYITLNSSMVRGQLSLQREALRERINEILSSDELFTSDEQRGGYVRTLILK